MTDPYAPAPIADPMGQPGGSPFSPGTSLHLPGAGAAAAAPIEPEIKSTEGENPFQTMQREIFGGQGFVHNVLTNPLAPFEAAGAALSHVPLAWVPGGANDQFQYLGDWIKQNDPGKYSEWLATQTAADADKLGGGNMKADYNLRMAEYYDEFSKTSALGKNKYLALGSGSFGSLGGALSSAIQGWLGLPSQYVNERMAGAGLLGQGTERLQRIVDAYNADPSQLTNPAELKVGENLASGKWDEVHAVDYLISHGAGYSENPWANLAATMILDPTTWSPVVAGRVAKLGFEVTAIARSLREGGTIAEKSKQLAELRMALACVGDGDSGRCSGSRALCRTRWASTPRRVRPRAPRASSP